MKIFLVFWSMLIILCVIELISANYEFSYRAMEMTIPKDDKFMNGDKLKIRRTSHNEPHKMYGNFVFFQDVTKEVDLLGELYIKQGGEFRKTVYKLKKNLCELIAAESVFYPSMASSIVPPFPEKCDIPAGNYSFNGYTPDTSTVPPVFATGDYMVHVQFLTSEDGKLLQGAKIYYHVINQKGGMIGLK